MKFVEDAIIYLIEDYPFYAHLLSRIKKIVDDRVELAGVGVRKGQILLYINPFVFNQLTIENRAKILKHEILHLLALHITRQGEREDSLWNISCDITVNQHILGIPIKQKVNLKEIKKNTKSCEIKEEFKERELGGYTFDRVEGPDGNYIKLPPRLFSEEYYNLIKKEYTNQQEVNSKNSFSHTYPQQNECNQQENQNENSGENDTDPQKRSQIKGECRSANNIHPTWKDSDGIPDDIVEAIIKEAIEDTINKSKCEVPNEAKAFVDKLMESKTNWKYILRMFVAKHVSYNRYSTFRKTNRRLYDLNNIGFKDRYVSKDICLPSFKYQRIPNLVVAIDTSASVGEEELNAFAAEIIKIRKEQTKVHIVECDAVIQRSYDLKRELKPEFKGRGATDFRPVWRYIQEKKLRPDGIIYLTDGDGQAPINSKIPTLWTLVPDGQKPCDWGKAIEIDI
ncbi:VWA-like domain-containing protein [Wukongibacter baidiensis]|uniref:vWA domain-containing protein n=1 Tax=Wukongibacter baidiensis TaxID=1723361 RepID=UPI003D7FA5F3